MGALAEVLSTGSEQTPYWAEIHDLRLSLAAKAHRNHHGQPFLYITSISDKYRGRVGGATCEATIEVAAQTLAINAHGGASHRLSNAEEIEKFKQDQIARAEEARQMAEDNNPTPQTTFRVEGLQHKDGSLELKPIHEKKGENK